MDKKNHNKSKVTLGMLKGKPINASVPSIAIRFNATAEAIEELYVSDGERGDSVGEIGSHSTAISDSESSPAKANCGAKLSKRSTSIDVSIPADASPPSDPWRFFSDIKGKITKSVEGKFTEYKSRTAEGENSPKTSKPNKENSSLSDSEELSESSISRTCGIASTTEGAEMSSDDETTSLSDKEKDKDRKAELQPSSASAVKKKYRVVRDKEVKQEGVMSSGFLENLQNINMGLQVGERSDIESGVDALLQFENVVMDGDDMVIKQVSGTEIRDGFLTGTTPNESTVLAPTGYVDLRSKEQSLTSFDILYRIYLLALVGLLLYFYLPLSAYSYGFIAGNLVMLTVALFYIKVFIDNPTLPINLPTVSIMEIQAAKEIHPAIKYEGWVNEYPEIYDPYTYHISQTQPVYLRLQGNLLKISHTKSKIPKRALWNEAEHKLIFTRHRIYNLLGAKIHLLPHGLTKIRHWSKKYPICITLLKDQYNFDYPEREVEKSCVETEITEAPEKNKKKQYDVPQVFSKLADDALTDSTNDISKIDDDDGASHPNREFMEDAIMDPDAESMVDEMYSLTEYFQEEDVEEWPIVEPGADETAIYIFARTDREKEHWYRRLASATHKQVLSDTLNLSESDPDVEKVEGDTLNTNSILQTEYLKFMSRFMLINSDSISSVKNPAWLNALISRVSFDLVRNPMVISKIKERIQRKLSAIKLPYFIEELTLTELSLGNNAPCVREINTPVMDEWGLWVDLHTTFDGHVRIILQTKLNLMKLKHPQTAERPSMEKSPIFNSDVDDTAESSTDDEAVIHLSNIQGPLDATGNPIPGLGGTSNKGKKFIRIVDRIAESKFFQAAAENKYIKRAIEGVSNTELGLKVEVKALDGILVLNIPTPPSDRVWVGFRPSPKLVMTALPIVGERNINFLQVTSWIEKKLFKEFQKLLVIPNMEDIHLSVMMQMLPK